MSRRNNRVQGWLDAFTQGMQIGNAIKSAKEQEGLKAEMAGITAAEPGTTGGEFRGPMPAGPDGMEAPAPASTPTMHSLLGQSQETPFTPQQQQSVKSGAMAQALEKRGDWRGAMQMRAQQQAANEADVRSQREAQLFPLQLGAAQRGERIAATAEADQQLLRDVDTEAGTWLKGRLKGEDGTERAADIKDNLAATQYRATLLFQKGKPEAAQKALSEYNALAAAQIQLQSAQRGEAVGKTAAALAAGDLNAVKEFYNEFVPDGARVTNVGRGPKGEVVIERESSDGRPMPPHTLKDPGQMLAALNSFKDPMSLYNWSQNEFKNNIALAGEKRADRQVAISGGHLALAQGAERRAAETHAAGASGRELNSTLAGMELELAKTDDPAKQKEIQTKLLAVRAGMGKTLDGNQPADVKVAQALVAAGKAPDMGAALEMALNNPDKVHKAFVETGLKDRSPADAVKLADETMKAMGYTKSGSSWNKAAAVGGGASFASEADAAAAAKAGKLKKGDKITIGGQSGTWQ